MLYVTNPAYSLMCALTMILGEGYPPSGEVRFFFGNFLIETRLGAIRPGIFIPGEKLQSRYQAKHGSGPHLNTEIIRC